MSNVPTPDIELLFPSPTTRKMRSGSASSSATATEPTMRICLSKRHNTIEISRFIPFTTQSSVSPQSKTRLPNATEVTKGEWSKKVVPIPKDGSLVSVGVNMGMSERDGLAHLDECRAVCAKLVESVIAPAAVLPSASSPRESRGGSTSASHNKMEMWESFVDERGTGKMVADSSSEGQIPPRVLHEDAWNTLLRGGPIPAGSDSPSPVSRILHTDLAREVDERISHRPTRPRFSGPTVSQCHPEGPSVLPSEGVQGSALYPGAGDDPQFERTPRSSEKRTSAVLNATLRMASSSTLNPAKGPGRPTTYTKSTSISQLSKGETTTQFVNEPSPYSTETRFLPALGWCIKTMERGAPPKYKVMFLDGASLEVNDGHPKVVLIDRAGKRTER